MTACEGTETQVQLCRCATYAQVCNACFQHRGALTTIATLATSCTLLHVLFNAVKDIDIDERLDLVQLCCWMEKHMLHWGGVSATWHLQVAFSHILYFLASLYWHPGALQWLLDPLQTWLVVLRWDKPLKWQFLRLMKLYYVGHLFVCALNVEMGWLSLV